MGIIHTITDLINSGILPTDGFDIPELDPDFSSKPATSGLKVVNQILGIAVLACLVGGIGASLLLAFAGLSERGKSRGWIALTLCFAGVVILGSIVGFLTFASKIELF